METIGLENMTAEQGRQIAREIVAESKRLDPNNAPTRPTIPNSDHPAGTCPTCDNLRKPVRMELTLKEMMDHIDAGDYLGICTACGSIQDNVEPDARNYACTACNMPDVFGLEEYILNHIGR